MKSFFIAMSLAPPFKKGEILTGNLDQKLLVIKVYKMTWLKKMINKTWFKRKWFIGLKVKPL